MRQYSFRKYLERVALVIIGVFTYVVYNSLNELAMYNMWYRLKYYTSKSSTSVLMLLHPRAIMCRL